MKILILGFGKIKFMPYVNFYLQNLDRENNDIHLLYWNRDLQNEDTSHLKGITLHEFKCFQEDDVSKTTKLKSFLKYRAFALNVLKNEHFDFIIVLHSLTGLVVGDYLKKHFKGKFIFDYRDVTYEGFAPFKSAVASLVENSLFTFVSSDSFRAYLPKAAERKIHTIHNLDAKALAHNSGERASYVSGEKIKIGFWGFIRNEELNLKIIEQLGNDDRFELHYYGREQQIAKNLKAFAEGKKCNNVFFHGEYSPEERYDFIKEIHLIHNIYDTTGEMLAVGNKYYDGVVFSVPQVCMVGSYMGSLCIEKGIGFVADPYSDSFKATLCKGLCSLQGEEFSENCHTTVEGILREQEKNIALVKSIR